MIVVDSDVLIWILRGDTHFTARFKETLIAVNGNIYITPVQIAEIYAGMRPQEKVHIDRFLAALEILAIEEKSGRLAGEFINRFGKSHNVTMADAMIASVVRLNACILWTKNKKHYPMLNASEFFTE